MDEYWLVSVDDHVIEPAGVWQDRLPARYRDAGPRWIRDDTGPAWVFENVRVSVNSTVTGGAVTDPAQAHPIWQSLDFDDMDPACYDPKARVKAMDADHVLASILFPNLPRFCGQQFAEATDRQLGLLCVKAYNDWMIDEWCSTAPERFIPNVLIPLWDPALAETELRRCADKGARAFMFSQAPHRLGLPSIHDVNRYWDPVFATAQEADLVVCTHLGSSSQLPDAAPDAPFTVSTTLLQFAGQETLLDWIYGDVFDRFPGLKVCLSENGIGWIPAVLEVAEMFIEAGRKGLPIPGETPEDKSSPPDFEGNANGKAGSDVEERGFLGGGSADAFEVEMHKLAKHLHELNVRDRFREHIYGCFIEDSHGLRNLDEIGVDNVMMETDFPHLTSTYPRTGSVAHEALKGFNEEDRRKLLFENAARVFRWNKELERFADSRADIDLRGMVSA